MWHESGRERGKETQSDRDRNAETEMEKESCRNSQGHGQKWNLIQSCPSPRHSKVATAHPASPGKGKRAFYSAVLLSASKKALYTFA